MRSRLRRNRTLLEVFPGNGGLPKPAGGARSRGPGRALRWSQAGFTLLEVIVAVFVLAILMGALLTAVQQYIARLADAQLELRLLELAEQQMRTIQAGAESGVLPEFGRSEDVFDEPDSDFVWELEVTRYKLPVPADFPEDRPLPSVFTDAPAAPGQIAGSLRLVSLRVYPAEADPAEFPPLIAILVDPLTLLPAPGAAAS